MTGVAALDSLSGSLLDRQRTPRANSAASAGAAFQHCDALPPMPRIGSTNSDGRSVQRGSPARPPKWDRTVRERVWTEDLVALVHRFYALDFAYFNFRPPY